MHLMTILQRLTTILERVLRNSTPPPSRICPKRTAHTSQKKRLKKRSVSASRKIAVASQARRILLHTTRHLTMTLFAVGIAAPEEIREHKRHKTARIHTGKTRKRLAVTFFTTKSGTKDKGGNSPHERVNAAFLRQCVLLTAAAIGTIFKATFNAPGETFCGKLITKANTGECYRNAWLILAIFDLFVLHPKLESICKYCVTITSATPPTEPLSSPTTQIVFLHQQILIGIEIVHDVMEVHAMCNCIRTPHDPPPWTRKCCTRCSDVQRKHITVLSVVSLIEPHTFRMPFSQVFNPNLLNPRTAPYNIARTPTGFIPESTKRYNEVNDIVSSFDC